MYFLLILPSLALFFTVLNFFTMRTVKPLTKSPDNFQSVSLLLPMRNEESNAADVLTSVLNQKLLTSPEILVLDDASSDNTAYIVQQVQSQNPSHISLYTSEQLPHGWLGKNWACYQLAEKAAGKYLVFVDADVRLHPTAVASSISEMEKLGLDYFSPHPREVALTFFEKLIQPLLQWSWMASVPLRLSEKLKRASMVIANGQFFIAKRDAYFSCGGHKHIAGEVLDDLELARLLMRHGFKGAVGDASSLAECRMYTSSKELIEGYSKSLWRAFGGLGGTFIACILLLCVGVFPLVFTLTGSAYGFIGYCLTSISIAISAAKTKSSFLASTLHPISFLLLLFLILRSNILHTQGKLQWKAREI